MSLSKCLSKGRVAFPKPLGLHSFRAAVPARHMCAADKSKSWMPKGDKMEEVLNYSLIHRLTQESLDTAERIVPWYLKMLPAAYFREVADATRMEHLKGLAALKSISSTQVMSLSLNSEDKLTNSSEISVLRTENQPGVLHQMLSSMQRDDGDLKLLRLRGYTSMDNSFCVNIFTYSTAISRETYWDKLQEDAKEHLEAAKHHLEYAADDAARTAVADYVSLCHPSYTTSCSPRSFDIHRQLYEAVKGSDRAEVRMQFQENNIQKVIMAVPTSMPEELLTKIVGLLSMRGIDIMNLKMDIISDLLNPVGGKPGSVCMIRMIVTSVTTPLENARAWAGNFNDLSSKAWTDLSQDLRRIKWLDKSTLDLEKRCADLGMGRAEVLSGLVAMLHGPLSKLDPHEYSRSSLTATVRNPFYSQFCKEIADLFLARFNPADPLSNKLFSGRSDALKERVRPLTNAPARIFLLKMIEAVELTLKTNFFMPNRYALAFRLDPSLIVPADKLKPFGVLFVHGHNFDGFHNRFQNIARGGLRLVSPTSAEQYVMESSRCYDEVYGLSLAQQMKNKDIPEGGGKAVVLVDLDNSSAGQRHAVLRNSVRAFTDAVLDLIVLTDETRELMVDHLGFDELIYLGPDEQIIPEDINWIIKQAAVRGYPIPAAFMSSKPLAGINHKEYGVTSEGVAVFLDVALRNQGINPNEQEFSIKITGGPDGDVAGNLMRILFREYGDNVKIVGIADGSGCAEDPAGLSHEELMRLFHAALPIGDLSASSLSSEGVLHLADTEEGIRMRNSMYNRVKADVFVPAGGRPNTIHEGNWEQFLDPETKVPSSPVIVEGANLFLSTEARNGLFDNHKVLIVKDSSANKCGVICSSYEICASMLLDEAEFLDIKEELVQDVLVRLRELAGLEAELMFREYSNYPGALPSFSERISKAINRVKEAIRQDLSGMQRGDSMYQELMPLFIHEHLPKKLAEVAGHRVDERIPLDYLRSAFSSNLASKLLYKEGTRFLESQPSERLAELAFKYYRQEKRMKQLLSTVASADLNEADRNEVLKLLERGGTRSALHVY